MDKKIRECKGILFAHVNINSIRNKFEEVCNFLQKHTIAVFAITESNLDAERDLTCMYQIPEYYMTRFDRDVKKGKKSGGGLIMYIHNTFKFDILDIDFLIPGRTQLAILKVYRDYMKPLLFTALYNPPDTDKTQFLKCFTDLNVYLSSFKYERIIVGDFNLNLIGKGVFDINTHKLLLLAKEFNMYQLIKGPTHNSGSLLDHMYVSNKSDFTQSFHLPFAGSDHDICVTARKKLKIKVSPRIVTCRKFSDIDWDLFNKDLQSYMENVNCENIDVKHPVKTDVEFNNFSLYVMNTLDKHAPSKNKIVKSKNVPWFNSEIWKLVKHRNSLLNVARKSNDDKKWKMYRKVV